MVLDGVVAEPAPQMFKLDPLKKSPAMMTSSKALVLSVLKMALLMSLMSTSRSMATQLADGLSLKEAKPKIP